MKMSFYDWCIKNNRECLLKLWDYELNTFKPNEIAAGADIQCYFKCPNNKHQSSLLMLRNVIRLKTTKHICHKCNSVAQALIDMYGDNAIETYWDYDANVCDPWEISIGSKNKIYIKCQKDPEHGSYDLLSKHFFKTGCRCPYCFHRRIVPKDSFAQYVIDNYGESILNQYWDYEKNSVSPWEISPSGKKCYYIKWVKYPDRDSRLVPTYIFLKELETESDRKIYTTNEKIKILQDIIDGKILEEEVYKTVFCGENLTGRVFGRLTVLHLDYNKYLCDLLSDKQPKYYWVCQCCCGGDESIKSILGSHLTHGRIISCGCLRKERLTGENHPHWKGGVNSESHKARHAPEGEAWRKSVYKRDNFKCQCCGSNHNLNAHHLYNFSDYVDIRYKLSNGITLCEDCHSATIKDSFHYIYKTRNNTPEQLREYILNKSNIDIYETHPEILQLMKHTIIIKND